MPERDGEFVAVDERPGPTPLAPFAYLDEDAE